MLIKVISGIFLNVYVALPTTFCRGWWGGRGAGTDGIEDICTFEISRSDTHFPVGNQNARRGQESWRTQHEPGFLS